MSNPKDKQAQAWDMWTSSLTSSARKAIKISEPVLLPVDLPVQVDDEDVDAYRGFRGTLTSGAKESIDQIPNTELPLEATVDPKVARYCCVESPDGEWAVVRMFKTPEGLARRLGQLEGEDIVARPFFGIPLEFTEGPQRYLMLPDGTSAIQIPLYDGGPAKLVPADILENLAVQEDGFLGPPELANTRIVDEKLTKASKKADDDDDDDEEEEGAEVE